jgi:hypothetical protein
VKLSRFLQPLVDNLERQTPPAPGRLIGKTIQVVLGQSPPYLALDADGHIHFLLTPCAAQEERLVRFRRRVLMIANRPWVVSDQPVSNFLDLTLLAPATSPMRRPFLSFCEDILQDLVQGGLPEEAVHRTCLRWQRFWAEDDSDAAPLSWVLGLLGELTVLRMLLDAGATRAVAAWTGPEAADHDFQAGTTAALEVKTTLTLPPVIECGLAQPDPGPAAVLLLLVVHARRQDDGTTLPWVVAEIEERLASDDEMLDEFLARLARSGYRRHLESAYAAHSFVLSAPVFYLVDDAFPRVTHGSFKQPLDARIQRLSYQVQLTGLLPLVADDVRLTMTLRAFAAPT